MAGTEVGKTIKNILAKVRQNTVGPNEKYSTPIQIEEEGSEAVIPHYHDPSVFEKMVAYCSDQAHSSVEKASMLSGVRLRKLKSTLDTKIGNYTVTRETLEQAIKVNPRHGQTKISGFYFWVIFNDLKTSL